MPSKDHGRLNRRTYDPDRVVGACMLNPHYPNLTCGDDRPAPWLTAGCEVDDDSGAFQEVDMAHRLTADGALDRQLTHEAKIRQHVPGFRFSSLVTYDMLVGVDEAYEPGPDGVPRRIKRRGTVETARLAVDETKRSAERYARRRGEIAGAITFSAQGAEPDQYLDCVEVLLGHVRAGVDRLALGGFCILGMQQHLLPTFKETVDRVVPLAVRAGCVRIHLLGVCWPPALEHLATVCGRWGIDCSTDSASVEVNSVMGKVWHVDHMARPQRGKRRPAPFVKTFTPAQKWREAGPVPDGFYHPADLALANNARFAAWCASLSPSPVQLLAA